MPRFQIQKRLRITDKSAVVYPVAMLPLNFQDTKLAKEQLSGTGYKGDPGCAIVRNDDRSIIYNVSSDYQLIPHKQIIEAVETQFNANKWNYELYDVHVGGRRGNKMYLRYHLPEDGGRMAREYNIPYVLVYNSYDKSLLFGAAVGLYRVRCMSTSMITPKSKALRMRHFRENIDTVKVAMDIEMMLDEVGAAKKELKVIYKSKISDKEVEALLPRIFKRKRDVNKIKELGILEDFFEEQGKTRYAFYNACNAYATHKIPDFSKNYDHEFEVHRKIARIFFK